MKKKEQLLKLAKETPEIRQKRVSSGIKFRSAIFEDKKKRLDKQDKWNNKKISFDDQDDGDG